RVAVEILHLLLRDLADLRLGHRAGDVAARSLGTAFELRRFFQKERHRRRAQLKSKRTIGIDSDRDRNRRALLQLVRLRLKCPAESHDVKSALTERGTDRG